MKQSIFSKSVSRSLCIGLLAIGLSAPAMSADLIVTVPSVSSSKGQMLVAVYNSAETFSKERLTGVQAQAVAGEMDFTFNDLPAGDYAVMIFHDVNGNGELDKNLLGIPKEPWGGSLQGKKIFGGPKWKDVRFSMPEEDLTLVVKLK